MVSVQSVLRQVPDPGGSKVSNIRSTHALLMLLAMLSGRKGMMAAGQQGPVA